MKAGTTGCPEIPDWLAENLQKGDAVGIDPFLHTVCCSSLLYHHNVRMSWTLVGLIQNAMGHVGDQIGAQIMGCMKWWLHRLKMHAS